MELWRKKVMNQYEEWLIKELQCIHGFKYQDFKHLDKYSYDISKDVLRILIENACLGQNYAPVELARKKISEISAEWLKENLLEIASSCIDFEDEWEYRRLMELIIVVIPELKNQLLIIGENSANAEVKEVVEDFRD